ncbi:gamma-interferon-responsive lysosomal thiol protein-like [Macadamia integrifolia]|uniref:gamma-interferon-responsive lysosomal thiol protein-like n=1 Tax=Macadamia integrifolia TaxID=60698 RepID=UPI001C4FDCD6|nr:gamma-interferon-responsive lysosomal thiol protein-like [Macadamia integrifolia]
MASYGFPSLLLLSCIFVFASATLSSPSSPKVSLALYYETLCPYCSRFVFNHLSKVFENGLITIIDLQLVPYGNAITKGNVTIICQHGPDECMLNTVEACAIDAWPDLTEHFKFISCIEQLVIENKSKEWESCFMKLNFHPNPIIECYNSGHGKELELKYASMTGSLNPPIQYVPWVTVNDQPLHLDYENFISYVCNAYKGTTVPEACEHLTQQINSVEKANPSYEVCFAD